MKAAYVIILLFLAIFFAWYNMLLAGLVCFGIAAYLMLSNPIKSFGFEVLTELEEAEGQIPDKTVWEEGLKAAGGALGDQAFSDNENPVNLKAVNVGKFKFKPRKVADASKKTGSLFKKLFG